MEEDHRPCHWVKLKEKEKEKGYYFTTDQTFFLVWNWHYCEIFGNKFKWFFFFFGERIENIFSKNQEF